MTADESRGTGPERPLVAHQPPVEEVRRPAHLSGASVILVGAGGAVGTGLRYGLTVLVPHVQGIPVAILTVNVLGAFALGLLLETLAELGPDRGLSRRLRLGIGTGVLGGFTTYSSLAGDTVLLALGSVPVALAYSVGTVIIGAAASMIGITVARRLVRPRIVRRRTAP